MNSHSFSSWFSPRCPSFVCVSLVLSLVAGTSAGIAAEAPAAPPRAQLRVAARTFSVTPEVGAPTSSRTEHPILKVYGPLENTIVLFESGSTRFCLVTSSLSIQNGGLNAAARAVLVKELGIEPTAFIGAGSHNHTVPTVDIQNSDAWGGTSGTPVPTDMPKVGRDFITALEAAAKDLDKALVPVSVDWGIAREDRFVYNRRGRRSDGRAYFIREEDRVELGEEYLGTIDPDAMVVVFRDAAAKPVASLALYTGHPVTGYNPETMVSHGQWPQIACDQLSRYLGGTPVAFLQGCAGDINSKGLLTGTIEQTEQYGEMLGESFVAAAKSLRHSRRTDMVWKRVPVGVPLAPLPQLPDLERDLGSIDDFIRRGRAGDPNTLECVGMNFPKALTPPYRAALVNMVRPWYVWAIDKQKTGTQVPSSLPMEVVVARFGDVGYVGMPFEPFVRIGLKIKREADLPCVLTSGYTEGSYGYIPDTLGVNDREYMGGFFRYVGNRPPYKAPGGDAVAQVTVPILAEFAK